MRIAICLNGQPRTWAKNVKNWIEVFSPWGEIDFFFHFWNYNSFSTLSQLQNGTTYDKRITEDELKFILDTLQPKKWLYEGPKNTRLEPNLKETIAPWAHSQFYSLWRSALLKRSYEIEKDFEYDIVIRLRADLVVDKFPRPDVKPCTLYTTHNATVEQCEYGIPRFSDIFFISDSLTFDHMSLFYESLNFIDSDHVTTSKTDPFPPELALTYYCSMMGIQIEAIHDVNPKVRRDPSHLLHAGSLASYEII